MASTTSAPLNNSTFLDYAGYGITSASTVADAYGFNDGETFTGKQGINVALMLSRQQDPTPLLSGTWASRQQALAQANSDGTLWKQYGADPNLYKSIAAQLKSSPYNLTLLTPQNSNYVSSPESRTIWFNISSSDDFQNLFGTPLLYSKKAGLYYWNGSLSLPQEWSISGIWLDFNTVPKPSNLAPGSSVNLSEGPQSPGNSGNPPTTKPQKIGSDFYNLPLQGNTFKTGTIGLIEPGVGTALNGDVSGTAFNERLQTYLNTIGQTSLSGSVSVKAQGADGQRVSSNTTRDERSLDVGVVAAINPNSPLVLYNGSGYNGAAHASVFTAAQSAAWDTVNKPQVTTNSYGDSQSLAPGSPFYQAYWSIFEDAALTNQTTLIALGDGGSGNETGNGLSNVENNITQPYNLIVGGTSLSSLGVAQQDPTLNQSSGPLANLIALALAQDKATLWPLMQGGLNQLPSLKTPNQRFLETVWNQYVVKGNKIEGYLSNNTSSGGVDTSQSSAPLYQIQYGLNPTSSSPTPKVGRGVPDVSANAGGNLFYLTPGMNMTGTVGEGGTSAATPFWASLITQLNAIFQDQGMSNLGYMNDLLYTASVVFPSAFNDVQVGNNISSFSKPGSYVEGKDNTPIQPTGFGYQAGSGYDLVSGLGSPNGYQLAVGLTNIARIQLSNATPPALLAPAQSGGSGLYTSGARQSLQFQLSSANPDPTGMELTIGSTTTTVKSNGSQPYAWTSQLAQQSLQSDFDANLVRLFDGAAQGSASQLIANAQDSVRVRTLDTGTVARQIELSAPYGFVDFSGFGGFNVRASRPVSIATTADNANNSKAVVRMRQNGTDAVSVFFYKVDDLTGTINGLNPGQAGYTQAAQARTYAFNDGKKSLAGAGFGNYSQGLLIGVNSGDLIAMGLENRSSNHTFWGFSQANEQLNGAPVNHLWNYGMNVFGFEDTFNGGDQDSNDAVVQLDYSSASGSQWLLQSTAAPTTALLG